MNRCPCCSNSLLRHIRHHKIYWFCPTCREEMPNLAQTILESRSTNQQLSPAFIPVLAVQH